MTSFVQLTKQSYSSSNPVVHWLNRREIHGRNKVCGVTSRRERAGAKRSSVQRTFIQVKFVLFVFFSFCFRCCWWILLKVTKLKVRLSNFGVQVISRAVGKRSIQPIRMPVRTLLNKSTLREDKCCMEAVHKLTLKYTVCIVKNCDLELENAARGAYLPAGK